MSKLLWCVIGAFAVAGWVTLTLLGCALMVLAGQWVLEMVGYYG